METLTKLKDVTEQVVLDRRHLHMHPELGFEEHGTSRFIADRLRSLGVEVRAGVAGTGVVGLIRGARRARPSCSAPTSTPSPSSRRTTSPTSRPSPA
jgi:metal-dependent amidase/aminoacylase/carboxypeptidase family protein